MRFLQNKHVITMVSVCLGLLAVVTPVYSDWSDNYATQVGPARVTLKGGVAQQQAVKVLPIRQLYTVKQAGNGFLGLELAIRPRRNPTVLSVFAGSPAEQMGIIPGDELVSAQGQPLFDRSAPEVDWALPNVVGQPVSVQVRRGFTLKLVHLWVAPLRSAG
jgi:hypothetical protein